MGNPLGYMNDKSLEGESVSLSGYIALDGSSNVIGVYPTTSPSTAVGPYTRAKGLQKAIGQAGAVLIQPHTATGTYLFTLDEAWFAASENWVQLTDQGAVATLSYFVDANVGSTQLGGAWPGNNPALAPQTVRVRFRNASGVLTDPVANTAFYLGMKLKRGFTV